MLYIHRAVYEGLMVALKCAKSNVVGCVVA